MDATTSEGVKSRIVKALLQYGDGARAVVKVYKLESHISHLFNVEVSNEKVIFYDAQTGKCGKEAEANFNGIVTSAKKYGLDNFFAPAILRIDNLNFTRLIQKCCKRNPHTAKKS